MKHWLTTFLAFIVLLPALFFPSGLAIGSEVTQISRLVDRICNRLESGESPEHLFQVSPDQIPLNQVRAKWLKPSQWIPKGNQQEINQYVGSLVYARLQTSFSKAAQAVVAYDSETKFIPGIVESKILERRQISKDREFILLERKRDLPLAVKALIINDGRYQIENRIETKENSWLLIRVRLKRHPSGEKLVRGLMKVIEGFEYVRDVGNGQVLYMSGGFALPNTGFLRIKKTEEIAKPLNPLNKATFGIFGKVVGGVIIVLVAWLVVDMTMKSFFNKSELAQKFGGWNEIKCDNLNTQDNVYDDYAENYSNDRSYDYDEDPTIEEQVRSRFQEAGISINNEAVTNYYR